jgi:hypothetical protein
MEVNVGFTLGATFLVVLDIGGRIIIRQVLMTWV